jgi:hypothetical protein
MRGMVAVLMAMMGLGLVLGTSVPAVAKKDKSKAAPAAKITETPEELTAKFKTFCDDWMGKLRERERNNIAHIEWKPGERGVVGEYVGYDTTNITIPELTNPDKQPIGRVVYMELKLRLVGTSDVDALAQKPEIVERTEVTELFRYERGSWVY